MKYTPVYHEDPKGFNWTVRNVHNHYAACQWADGRVTIRSWRTAAAAADYMAVYRHRNAPEDLVWAPWPEEKPAAIKPVTTAASYKPAHGGYPDDKPLVWPVIPQHDDGSNEEATTVPDSLVELMAQREFIMRLRKAVF